MTTKIYQTGIQNYCPELGSEKPVTHMEARLSHYGKHYFLKSKIQLTGRGIKFIENIEGFFKYKVTLKAFEKLENKYSIGYKEYLD